MDAPLPGLHASAPERLPFDPSLEIRTFLLERAAGNLLVYATGTLESDAAEIEAMGGVSRHYLNHHHEAMFAPGGLDAPIVCHEGDRDEVEGIRTVAESFAERHVLDDDFEVIPTPGHTSGATAYLWDSGRHRLLFTGDTVYLRGGEWVAAVLDSSDRAAYVESLELIRELDFDVLVPWASTRGHRSHAPTDGADATRRIDAILERLRGGASH